MTIVRTTLVALVVIAAAFAPSIAVAQSVEAESLFREGKRLMKEGKLAEACDKLEASDRLEPSVGTLLNLADCREKNHQLATAWATFLKASAAAKQAGNDAKREAEARKRARALEGRLAFLTISVSDASRVEGLVIKRNGQSVDPALWNQGVPVDPGTYEISGEAPGHEAWSTKVTISSEGQKASVEVPRFKRLEDLQPDVPKPGPIVTSPEPRSPREPEPEPEPGPIDRPSSFTGMRKAAVGAAVIGVGGIAAGVVFGLKASDLQKKSDAICPNEACNDMNAVKQNEDARSAATTANIAFAVGGVAIAGAAALWFLGAPTIHDEPVALTPTITPDQLGISFAGRF
jgi:hypothetical protein